MKNVAVIFGGKSVEHDISVITGLQAMSFFPKEYNLIPLLIDQSGMIYYGKELLKKENYLDISSIRKKLFQVGFNFGNQNIFLIKKNKIVKQIYLDCALLCTHGHGGEDGSLQGVLEIANIPYTSCGVGSSVLSINKILSKIMFEHFSIPSPTYVYFNKCEYDKNSKQIENEIKEKIGYPVIIKPSCLGSSVGIKICEDEKMLNDAIKHALMFDESVLVEKFLDGSLEFSQAVLKIDDKLYFSKVSKVNKGKMFSFDEKYIQEKRQNSEIESDEKIIKKIKNLSALIYQKFGCNGVVRIDYLMQNEKLYVNEINSIPGSLAFNLFDTNFSGLIKMLVEDAIKTNNEKQKIEYSFNSDAIKTYLESAKNYKTAK